MPALTFEQIVATLKSEHGDLIAGEDAASTMPHVLIDPVKAQSGNRFVELTTFCRDDPRLSFDLLNCLSAVDYPDRDVIEVVYMLDSTSHKHRLVLKAPLSRKEPEIPTVENVWRTADWHEREAYDLLGVRFRGHHNLVRILCAEDWEGHPLRKDYVIPEEYHGIKNVVY